MTTARSPQQSDLRWLMALVAEQTGLAHTGTHQARMAEAVRRLAEATGDSTYRAYGRLLTEDGGALDELVDELTVGETYFFREPAHFELLRSTIVPPLVAAGRGVRVWSAGCASGEEPYSIAITLDGMGVLEAATIVGTDASASALARARNGLYTPWSLRHCAAEHQTRWFTPVGRHAQLRDRYRSAVRFAQRNLLQGPPPGTYDVVLCRNVLIYLTAHGISVAASALHDALAPDGWLFVGASDPPLQHPGLHRIVGPHGTTYRRQPQQPAARPKHAGPPARRRQAPRRPLATPPARTHSTGRGEPTAHDIDVTSQPSVVARVEMLERIRRAGEQGHLDQALTLVGIAMAEHPTDAELRFLAATLQLAAGRAADAAREARAALYLEPDLVAAHLVLAQAHRRTGRLDLAGTVQRTALRLLEDHPADTPVPLTDGAPARWLRDSLAAELDAPLGDGARR